MKRIFGILISCFLIAAPHLGNENLENVAIFITWFLSIMFLLAAISPEKLWIGINTKQKYRTFIKIIFTAVVLNYAYCGWFWMASIYLVGYGGAMLRKEIEIKKLSDKEQDASE